MSASASIDSGVCWAGLTTIVQPAAIGRADLPGAHRQREVPGRDQQTGTDRVLADQQPRPAVGSDAVAVRRSAPPPRRTSERSRPRTRSRRATRAAACPSRASSAALARRRARRSPRTRGAECRRVRAEPSRPALLRPLGRRRAQPARQPPTRRRSRPTARPLRDPRPRACRAWRPTRRRCKGPLGPVPAALLRRSP